MQLTVRDFYISNMRINCSRYAGFPIPPQGTAANMTGREEIKRGDVSARTTLVSVQERILYIFKRR